MTKANAAIGVAVARRPDPNRPVAKVSCRFRTTCSTPAQTCRHRWSRPGYPPLRITEPYIDRLEVLV